MGHMWRILLVLVGMCNIADLVSAHRTKRSYERHQLIRVQTRSKRDLDLLKELQKRNLELEFWTNPSTTGKPVDIMVTPKAKSILHLLLKTSDMDYHVTIPDIQKAIDRQTSENPPYKVTPDGQSNSPREEEEPEFNFERYHTLDEIINWLQEMSSKHGNIMRLVHLGNSWEDRPIYAVRLSSNPEGRNPAIWLDAGIHSNEWVGPATMIYFINQLVNSYRKIGEMTWLVENLDWYILPVFNVDGYVHTWTHDRMWRKNRAQYSNNSDCVGVDLNRNWGYKWGEGEPEVDPCGRMYIGPHAVSEPEVKAVINFLSTHNDTIKAYLAYHSFSQLWMLPYSYTMNKNPHNFEMLWNMSNMAVQALKQVHGTPYIIGRISDLVGEASGASVDYTYAVLNIPYSFGIELRDMGRHGTLLPPSQILPNAEESLAAVKQVGFLLIDLMHEEEAERLAQEEQELEKQTLNEEGGNHN